MPEPAVDLLTLRFLVRQGGQAAGAPVDDVLTPIDEILLVQRDEHLPHRSSEVLVEREARPLPVTRRADRLELVEDRPACLLDEAPDTLDEAFPPEVLSAQPLLGELTLDHVLRGDPRVVRTGHPKGGAPCIRRHRMSTSWTVLLSP